MKWVASVFALLPVVADNLLGQDVSFVPFEGLVQTLRDPDFKPDEIEAVLTENTQEFVLYSLGPRVYASLVEENRVDKQIGASGGGSGSTSLVSRGSVPSLLSLAVEGGALYQSVSGSVVTFRLNPAGLARALSNHTYLLAGTPPDQSALEHIISRISLSTSFDFQQGASPGTFTAERSELREATARFNFINQRDPRHPSHAASIQKLRSDMGPLVATVQALFNALSSLPGYGEWRSAAAMRLMSVDFKDDTALMATLVEIGNEFNAKFASNPNFQRLAATMADSIRSYRTARDTVFEGVARGSTLTFEYIFGRMAVPEEGLRSFPSGSSAPDLSTARLILSSPIGTFGEATLNGSVTFFNSTLPEMDGNLRDIQIAGGVELRLPEIQSVGKPVLSFAGLAAFLHQQPFGVKVAVRDVETADGTIGVFQTKLTFPAGRSGVRIPVSFTVANRSEFNTETEVRGAIGVTFDMDQLFSRP